MHRCALLDWHAAYYCNVERLHAPSGARRELFGAIGNAHAAGCIDDGIIELFDASTGLACVDRDVVDVLSVRQFIGKLTRRHTYLKELLGMLCKVLDPSADAVKLLGNLSCIGLGNLGIAMARVAATPPPYVTPDPAVYTDIAIPCGQVQCDVRGAIQVRCNALQCKLITKIKFGVCPALHTDLLR